MKIIMVKDHNGALKKVTKRDINFKTTNGWKKIDGNDVFKVRHHSDLQKLPIFFHKFDVDGAGNDDQISQLEKTHTEIIKTTSFASAKRHAKKLLADKDSCNNTNSKLVFKQNSIYSKNHAEMIQSTKLLHDEVGATKIKFMSPFSNDLSMAELDFRMRSNLPLAQKNYQRKFYDDFTIGESDTKKKEAISMTGDRSFVTNKAIESLECCFDELDSQSQKMINDIQTPTTKRSGSERFVMNENGLGKFSTAIKIKLTKKPFEQHQKNYSTCTFKVKMKNEH